MKYMNVRTFVRGGYRELADTVTLTSSGQPIGVFTPFTDGGPLPPPTPEELRSTAGILGHVISASPRPAQAIGHALTGQSTPERTGASRGQRPTEEVELSPASSGNAIATMTQAQRDKVLRKATRG